MRHKNLEFAVTGELEINLVRRGIAMPENEKEKRTREMRFSMGSSSAITARNLGALAATEMGGTEPFKELATIRPRFRRIIDGC